MSRLPLFWRLAPFPFAGVPIRHYAFLVGPSSTPARCRDWMHGTYGGQDKAVVVTTPSAALLFVACLSIRLPAPDAKFEELSVELFGEGASNQ
jgi:hypothetical protein